MPQPARTLQLGDGFFTQYLRLSHTQASGLRFFQSISPATRDIFGHVLVEEKEPAKLTEVSQKWRRETDSSTMESPGAPHAWTTRSLAQRHTVLTGEQRTQSQGVNELWGMTAPP